VRNTLADLRIHVGTANLAVIHLGNRRKIFGKILRKLWAPKIMSRMNEEREDPFQEIICLTRRRPMMW